MNDAEQEPPKKPSLTIKEVQDRVLTIRTALQRKEISVDQAKGLLDEIKALAEAPPRASS